MGPAAGEEAVPFINVTPLIDVLLVLLIIFMVVTPLKPSRFEAKIPSEPDPNQDLSQLKPNPLTLVVTIFGDFKLKLNQDDMGSTNDTGALSSRLVGLFEERKRAGAFRTGTQDVEKTVFVKAPRSIKYGEVVKVIDAIKGAGANPVGLQVDDLAQ
jgi:biopolymer transport protein ExbD